jgi:hypothetical protein
MARSRSGYSRATLLRINPLQLAAGQPVAREALDWADVRVRSEPVLIYATATPDDVKAAQREIGVERAGALVEQALAEIAKGSMKMGVRKLVVAGGETAGAVVGALGIRALRIGPQIDPGVPWTESLDANRSRWRSSPAISAAPTSSPRRSRRWSSDMQESAPARADQRPRPVDLRSGPLPRTRPATSPPAARRLAA